MPVDRIDLVLAVDEKYAQAVGAVACAARWYIPPCCRLYLHILDGGVSRDTRHELRARLAERAEVLFYEVDGRMKWEGPYTGMMSHLNDTVLVRLQLGDVLPADIRRVVYLDVDLLVHGDLSILSSWSLDGHVLGAVADRFMPGGSPQLSDVIKEEHGYMLDRYFNAGVLVIDLEAWRAQAIGARLRAVMARLGGRFGFPDQDALNYVLIGNWQALPREWNYLVGSHCMLPTDAAASRLLEADGIVHFTGGMKPWHASFPEGPFRRLFVQAAEEGGWQLT